MKTEKALIFQGLLYYIGLLWRRPGPHCLLNLLKIKHNINTKKGTYPQKYPQKLFFTSFSICFNVVITGPLLPR
jgi:hypothetical protein